MVHAHTPKPVYEQEDVTVLWNQAVHRQRSYSKQASYNKNKQEKTRLLIDVAIPADRNYMQNEAEKKLKYKNSCTEIQRM